MVKVMTDFQSLLGTTLPLIQAPMAGSQGAALAEAVDAAGALGSLPAAMLSPESLAAELQRLQERLGPGASQEGRLRINVNFFCHRPPVEDKARLQAWESALAPYAQEWGVNPVTAPAAAARKPFDAGMAEVLEAFRPAVVSFHFGLPEAGLLERVRAWGAHVLSSATTVEEARWLEAAGVDGVIAQGLEAGGHRGMFLTEDLLTQSGTFALVPQVVRAVSVPVVAAGGIADAAGVRAALSLGACAVQVGTAFLGCPEASTSAVHRRALERAGGGAGSGRRQGAGQNEGQKEGQNEPFPQTALTRLFSGRPARGLMNRLMRELGPLNPVAPAFPLASVALQPIRQKAEAAGCEDFSPLWCGQHPPRWMNRPAAEIVGLLMETSARHPTPS